MPDQLIRGKVSFSQVSKPCGYQLLMDMEVRSHDRGEHEGLKRRLCRRCQGVADPPKSIGLIFGNAFEAACQYELQTHEGADMGLTFALQVLREEVMIEEATNGVRWDDPPNVRKDGKPYQGQENRMPTIAEAERNMRLGVPAWVNRFGPVLNATAYQDEADIPLHGDYEGWFVACKLDVVTDEGGFLDWKASGSGSWSKDDLDDKLDQLHIYHLAHEIKYGRRAEYGAFHLLHTGTERIELIDVPYDRERIETVLEDRIYPFIRAKERDALTPNTKGWHHSEKFCDHWALCPHGKKARGGFTRLELVA